MGGESHPGGEGRESGAAEQQKGCALESGHRSVAAES